MFYERAFTLIRRGYALVEADKQSAVIKIVKYIAISFFQYNKVVVYETDTREASLSVIPPPEIGRVEYKIIPGEEHLTRLMKEGYNFDFYPQLKVDKDRFKIGAKLAAIFVNRELVYKNWLGLTPASAFKLVSFVKSIAYEGQAVEVEAKTDPQYRGRGIYQYAIRRNLNYLRQMDKSSVLAHVDDNNLPSRKARERTGGVVKYTGYKITLFYVWDIFRLRPVANSDQPKSPAGIPDAN